MITVSTKGQITLPKSARTAMGLQPGQRVSVELMEDNSLRLRRIKDIEEFRGILKDVLPQDAVAMIRKQRDEEWT